METEQLIEGLVDDLAPVQRISRPGVRLLWWTVVSLPAAGLVVWLSDLRPDLATKLADPGFLVAQAAALLTALIGTYAALCAGLPDTPAWKIWLPLAPMALWLGTLGRQCLDGYIALGPEGLRLSSDAMCIPAVALGGVVPAVTTVALLWRTREFRTSHACLCGGLGAAALGAAALRFYHTVDATVMVIVWQLGSVALFSLVAGGAARLLLGMRGTPKPGWPA